MADKTYQDGERITFLCLLGNILLTAFKGFAGFWGGSRAMVADALHSASDIMATLVVFFGLKIAKKPADEKHPYGHGKVEPIASAFVGIIMVGGAFAIVKEIIVAMAAGYFSYPSFLALGAAAVSIAAKEGMFRVTYNVGKKINSQSIIANAWDHRADAYSSIGSFCGILGTIIGNHFSIDFLRYLDPVAGLLVSLLIFKVAAGILLESLNRLMDASPDQKLLNDIAAIAKSVEGIKQINWIKGRYAGRHLVVDMAIEVAGTLSVEEGHSIAQYVEERITEEIKEVSDVLIHVNPTLS
ncbi:MAG TPA: cation transporter [Firmicutes bacterium]|nr:cation transporter [Bacillota bacterium]